MPAMVAVDPGEAVLRIAAGEESPDDVLLDAAAEAAFRPQFRRMPGGAPVQRARAWFAWPIYPASGSLQRGQPLPGIYVSRCKAVG
jgi:hypothetical protein